MVETMAGETLLQPALRYRISKRVAVAGALLVADAILTFLVISFVPYTKIDWDAYMSQVSGFLGGERDYENLEGDTGPLVYPAGFLYVYSAIQFITGGEVYPAQIIFGILYVINLGIVFFVYVKTNVSRRYMISIGIFISMPFYRLPWWAFCLLCLSKRVHSIFVLRLFNDCFATTLLHASLAFLLSEKWHLALIIFSGAVSIKMNVLLYAPSLLLLMLKGLHIGGVISALLAAASVQIFLALPFLLSHPISYISRAFNLGRVFIHFWSVNFKFVREEIFVSKEFAIILLILHLVILAAFSHYKWCRHEGGIFRFLSSRIFSGKLASSPAQFFAYEPKVLNANHIVTLMFVGNFIGIIFARSLHYQFYSWYFHSLPFLLWKTRFPTPIRLILFAGVELCWNIYPSNVYSSFLLFCIHLTILLGLWFAPSECPYVDSGKPLKKDE